MTVKSAEQVFGLGEFSGQPGLWNRSWEQFDTLCCFFSTSLLQSSEQNGLCTLSPEKPSGLGPVGVWDTQELAVFPREMLLLVVCCSLSVAALTSTSFCCFSSCAVLAKPLCFCWSSSDAFFMPLVDLKSVQCFKLVQKASYFGPS